MQVLHSLQHHREYQPVTKSKSFLLLLLDGCVARAMGIQRLQNNSASGDEWRSPGARTSAGVNT